MAPTTIRKAIGAVKDQTSIGIAKVVGNVAPDLEVLIVKATSHDDEPADDKYIREIINLTSHSRGYVDACVFSISKRLSKTHDWSVAIKALMLVHKLLVDGSPLFGEQIIYASRKGTRVLNMSDFCDEAHTYSWDHVGFVKSYALYLDQKIEFSVYERRFSGVDDDKFSEFRVEYGHGVNNWPRSYGDLNEPVVRGVGGKRTPLREMKPEKVSQRLNQLLRLLDRFLACRPTGAAKDSRIILVAVYSLVKESFKLYVDLCEVLHVLLDRFSDMEYGDCLRSFDTYVGAAKMIDELVGFYSWCKDTGIARSSEYPELQEIADKLMEKLEGFLRKRAIKGNSREKTREVNTSVKKEEMLPDYNEIKPLPPLKDYNSPTPQPRPQAQPNPETLQPTEDLVNLKDDAMSVEVQGNKLALALFSETPAVNPDGSWEVFPSDGEPGMTSAWQTPAAEMGKADWELTLVETASNLSKQKADMGGGIDSLLLSGMYDQGAVKQHVSNAQLNVGSASSVTLPGTGKGSAPVLALPAPDGTVQTVGNRDPFAASLVVPPPSYVQMADMEMKQHLLVQEKRLWQQYANNGMQGQVGSANATGGSNGCYNGTGQPGGYYYHSLLNCRKVPNGLMFFTQ